MAFDFYLFRYKIVAEKGHGKIEVIVVDYEVIDVIETVGKRLKKRFAKPG